MFDEPTSSYVGQAGGVNTVAMLHGTQDVYMITHHLCMVHVDCNTLLWKTIKDFCTKNHVITAKELFTYDHICDGDCRNETGPVVNYNTIRRYDSKCLMCTKMLIDRQTISCT